MKFKVEWFCLKCWQEGTVELERHPAATVADIPEVQKDHARIVKGIIGRRSPCPGDIREPERTRRPRVKRDKPPALEFTGEPIDVK